MAAPARPVTPQRSSLVQSSIHSTPLNLGSAHNSPYATKHTQSDYRPYIEEDLKHREEVSYNAFRIGLFGEFQSMMISDEPMTISGTEQYQKLVGKFAMAVPYETKRYAPFVELMNYIFEQMNNLVISSKYPQRLDVLSCRNDPTYIRGSKAQRSPDVVLAPHNEVKRDWGGVNRTTPDGLTRHPFRWSHITSFFEHKHPNKGLLACTAPPPEHSEFIAYPLFIDTNIQHQRQHQQSCCLPLIP